MKMRLYASILISLFLSSFLHSQCISTVKVVFLGINYKAGCDFNDGGGLDPKLDLYNLAGDRIYNSHYSDQSQITGPQNNVPIDFNISVNTCGNFSNSFTLGSFPSETTSFEVTADIYEKDSNFLNDQCGPFNPLFDGDYSSGTHVFDFTQVSGVLDVGGCMTYNYVLETKSAGTITIDLLGPLCASDTIYVGSNAYHRDQPTGTIMVQGLPNACDTIYNIDLSFNDDISFLLEGPSSFCAGDTAQLFLNESFQDYLWSDGSSSDILDIDKEGLYAITVTSFNGCTKVATILVNALPLPNFSIIGDDSICSQSSIDLSLDNSGNAVEWSNGMTTEIITISQAGLYEVTVTDLNGCSNTDALQVVELSSPTPAIIGPIDLCLGDSITLEADQPYASYEWSNQTELASLSIGEAGRFSLTVTDSNGCTGSESITVTAYDAPSPTINGGNNICVGMSTTISVCEDYISYEWNNGNTSKEILVNTEGTYLVTVTDINGCTSSITHTVTESNQINPTIIGKIEICEGETNAISVQEGQLQYLWQDGTTEQERIASTAGTYSVTVTDNSGCTGNSSVTVVVLPQNIFLVDSLTCYLDRVKTEEVIIPNPSGCDDIVVYNIVLNTEALCGIDYSANFSNESCIGSKDGNYELAILAAYYPVQVELYDSAGNIFFNEEYNENDSKLNISNLAQGEYELVLSADNDYIEMTTIDISLQEFLVAAPETIFANSGERVILEASLDASLFESYFWSQDGITLCPDNCTSHTITANESAIFEFYAQKENTDCEFIVQTEVIVNPPQDLYIPSLFSPSATGENDKFRISGPGTTFISSLTIYDRWGNLISHSEGSEASWDGTYNGKTLAPGVFLYVLELNANNLPGELSSTKTGSLTLMR